jgi:uncharacterized repeat protein (TIGR01451 family)
LTQPPLYGIIRSLRPNGDWEGIGLMREVIGRSTRRLAIIGIPLALLLALVVVLGVWADDEAPAVVSGGNLVQYQVMLGDVEGGRFEILLPDGFEYVGLAAGSGVTVEPDVSRGGRRVVWSGPFPAALEARFWVYSTTAVDVPPSLHVDGAGVEAEHVEPLRGLLVEDDAEAPTDAEPTPDADAEATPEQGAEATAEAEPVPDVDAEATAEAEAIAEAEATAEAEPTPDVDAESTADAEAQPTSTVDPEATADAEATPDVEATAEEEPTPTADAEPTVDAEPTADAEPTPTSEPEAEPTPEIEEVTPVEVQAATVTVDKSVEPGALEPGDHRWVTYIVTFTNDGGGTVTLDSITDTLPSGFLFGGMALFSEVGEPVDPAMPEAVWEGVTVPGSGTRTLRYYAKAPTRAGDYHNSVVAQVGTALVGPETVPLYVEGGTLFLPSIIRKFPEGVPLPYEENFDVHPPANWEPFTNYPGLDAGRWWVALGAYNYKSDRVLPEYKDYDLSMFNAPGSELWTDYRIEARMKDSKDHAIRKGMTGIWFRGTYQNSGAMDGESVGGYYLFMRPWSDDPAYQNRLFLMRIPKDDMALDAATIVDRYHYEPGIGRKKWYDVRIDVQGNHIQVWFGRPDSGEPMVKAIDWYDSYPAGAWTSGTVGFATYFTESHYDYIRVSPLP